MKKLIIGLFLFINVGWLSWHCSGSEIINSEIEAEIGRHLFFDKRLSYNNSKSCASCHDPYLAFTDGYHRSIGANGDIHKRNAPSLLNLAENRNFTMSDSTIHKISLQVEIPLFNTQFMELGAGLKKDEILSTINNDSLYKILFSKIKLKSSEWNDLSLFIESYCLGLVSRDSKYDRVISGKESFTNDEEKGFKLFFSKNLGCSSCHGGIDFDSPVNTQYLYSHNGFFTKDSSHVQRKFGDDFGLFELTGYEVDKGKFRIPSLRNCAITAPYLHDGSINTLDSLISVYGKAGYGYLPPHPAIKGFEISSIEKKQLMLFLQTLTDTSYLSNRYFIDPFAVRN